VSIRHLKQIHSATHPAQLPKKDGEAKPDETVPEELLNARPPNKTKTRRKSHNGSNGNRPHE
jgi:hypothetical protein